MYLGDKDGKTYLVDTLTNDVKQFDNYDAHLNVVLIWIKTIENKTNKKGSYTESAMLRCAIDTTTNQLAVKSVAIYHNETLIESKNLDYTPWQDIIPESTGDIFTSYCRALHNQSLMDKFISNAELHNHKYSPKGKKSTAKN